MAHFLPGQVRQEQANTGQTVPAVDFLHHYYRFHLQEVSHD